jgi:hypothetical protein
VATLGVKAVTKMVEALDIALVKVKDEIDVLGNQIKSNYPRQASVRERLAWLKPTIFVQSRTAITVHIGIADEFPMLGKVTAELVPTIGKHNKKLWDTEANREVIGKTIRPMLDVDM